MFHMFGTMAADDLVMQGARASAAMIWTNFFSGIIKTFHTKGKHTNGLMQERRNSIATALELRLSCTNPSQWIPLTLTYQCDNLNWLKISMYGTQFNFWKIFVIFFLRFLYHFDIFLLIYFLLMLTCWYLLLNSYRISSYCFAEIINSGLLSDHFSWSDACMISLKFKKPELWKKKEKSFK